MPLMHDTVAFSFDGERSIEDQITLLLNVEYLIFDNICGDVGKNLSQDGSYLMLMLSHP